MKSEGNQVLVKVKTVVMMKFVKVDKKAKLIS